MNLKERNYAGDHVVVGSLEVLGDVKGGAMQQIKRNIDLIQKQTEQAYRQQNEYWTELSSDGVITPLEKQQLLKEFRQIQQSQAAIIIQARSVGMEESEYVQDYLAVYNDLYTYLYTTLKLFDDMERSTDIYDRATFNTKFANYYYDESFVLIALTKGILSGLNIRVLSSLLDEGEEGEVAIYRGGLYQYVNGAWKNVSTGNYKGALTTLPTAEQDSFFLAADDFSGLDVLYVNDEPLYVNDEELYILRVFRKGYIYYCQDNEWYEQTDKSNYMYVAAFADVLNVTGELPQIFQDAIDDLQDEIDALSERVPKYFGPSSTDPQNPNPGDYFVYSGTSTVTRRNSDIYIYRNGDWERLDPLESQNSIYYMQALEDILQLNNAGSGYFADLFAQALFANNAFLYALSTKIITLREGGYIQSENYSQERTGFSLDYDGNVDASGNTHIAGKVAIGVDLQGNTDFSTYDCVIGGNTKIGGNAVFEGQLKGGDVYCSKLGFYRLLPGEYVSFTEKIINAALQNTRRIRFSPCCYESTIRLYSYWSGYAGGDAHSRPSVTLGIYYKINGTVSILDYDYVKIQTFTDGTAGTVYEIGLTQDVYFTDPTNYVEVLFTYTTTGIQAPPSGKMQMKLSVNNPLPGRFAVFEDIT